MEEASRWPDSNGLVPLRLVPAEDEPTNDWLVPGECRIWLRGSSIADIPKWVNDTVPLRATLTST